MIGAGYLFIGHRQSVSGAMAGEIRGLLAQQLQLGVAGHQRQRFLRAAGLHHRRVAARGRFVQPELDVEIAVADRLEVIDARYRHAGSHVRVRQRHRGEVSAGGPACHHDAMAVAAERRQLSGEIIDRGVDFADDLVQRRIRRQRITGQRDIDAMRHRAVGKQRKGLLGPGLPIAAMDEQQRRRLFPGPEEIDPVALARAISQIKVIGILRPLLLGTPVPAGDEVEHSQARERRC